MAAVALLSAEGEYSGAQSRIAAAAAAAAAVLLLEEGEGGSAGGERGEGVELLRWAAGPAAAVGHRPCRPELVCAGQGDGRGNQ